MTVSSRFPMRKTAYYITMALWEKFGVAGSTFTNEDAEVALDRHIAGGLAPLRRSGVIVPVDGGKRAHFNRKKEMRTRWRFTDSFDRYMRSPRGQEEHIIAMEYLRKIERIPYRKCGEKSI